MKQRDRRDAFTLAAAALLLAAGAFLYWVYTERARERREQTLTGVPEFPRPGQTQVRRPPPVKIAQQQLQAAAPLPAPEPRRPPRDKLTAFALAPGKRVAVVQVNALLNSPLWSRIKECSPEGFDRVREGIAAFGIDFERDIDRVALVPGGLAVSGFFEGKELAPQLAERWGGAQPQRYRDQTLYKGEHTCVAQLGTLLVAGDPDQCEGLVDRALDGAPPQDAEQELYGEIYARTDLGELKQEASGQGDLYAALVKQLDSVTLRANVWDQVAVTLDGQPSGGGSAGELAAMARGLLSLARSQIGEDDVELRALAELAQVRAEDGKLSLDLAMPVNDLFDKLHLPCPGRQREKK
jgi:hypothetical protein